MRNFMCFALAAIGFLCAGCGGEDYTTDDVGGIKVKIGFPPKAIVASNTKGIADDKGKESGIRYTHTSTDSAGAKKVCVVEIAGSVLTVNGKEYGSVAKGDLVVIDGDTVKVNGTTIGATPPALPTSGPKP